MPGLLQRAAQHHGDYGFADQLAFENLWDSFVQLRLSPHPMLALDLFVHQFRLLETKDSRYAAIGAFDETAFGFAASPSNGHRNVGTEYDGSSAWRRTGR